MKRRNDAVGGVGGVEEVRPVKEGTIVTIQAGSIRAGARLNLLGKRLHYIKSDSFGSALSLIMGSVYNARSPRTVVTLYNLARSTPAPLSS